MNGAHFELGTCSVPDNGLITNVPVLQFMQCQQPGQKPWWAVRGVWGCKQEKEEIQEFGRRRDIESRVTVVVKNITPRGSVRGRRRKRNERQRSSRHRSRIPVQHSDIICDPNMTMKLATKRSG